MILIYKITLKKLSEDGRNHKWPNCPCEKCHRNMWGHGYVARYFSNTAQQLFLKRYRCPDCGKVITARPEGFWPFIRTPILTIYQMLRSRILCRCWPANFSRQTGGHWLRRFVIHAKMSCETNLLTFLDRCFDKQLQFFP